MIFKTPQSFFNFCLLFMLAYAHSTLAYERELSIGLQTHTGKWTTENAAFDNSDHSDSGYHLGFRLYNTIGKNKNHYLGTGIDINQVLGDRVIGYRALDYKKAWTNAFRTGAFFGAASIDTGLPQNGYYTGINASYFVFKNMSVTYEFRHGNGLARDRITGLDPEADPGPGEDTPDIFLDFNLHSLQFGWHF